MIDPISILFPEEVSYFLMSFLLYLFSSTNLVEDKEVMLVFDLLKEKTLYFRDYLLVEFDV